jgi:hypothetical protein
MEEIINTYTISVRISEGNKLGRPTCGWELNTKKNLQGVKRGLGSTGSRQNPEHGDEPQGSMKEGHFLTSGSMK